MKEVDIKALRSAIEETTKQVEKLQQNLTWFWCYRNWKDKENKINMKQLSLELVITVILRRT